MTMLAWAPDLGLMARLADQGNQLAGQVKASRAAGGGNVLPVVPSSMVVTRILGGLTGLALPIIAGAILPFAGGPHAAALGTSSAAHMPEPTGPGAASKGLSFPREFAAARSGVVGWQWAQA